MSLEHPAPDFLCGRIKLEPPYEGETCVFLPHAGSPVHSWEPRSTATEDTRAPYVCEFCTSEHKYASAMLACVERCANDRGRE